MTVHTSHDAQIARMRKASHVVYAVCEKTVADDIAAMLRAGADALAREARSAPDIERTLRAYKSSLRWAWVSGLSFGLAIGVFAWMIARRM